MKKRCALSLMLAFSALAVVALAFQPAAAAGCSPGTGVHTDPVNDPLDPTDSGSTPEPYLDIVSWNFCGVANASAPGGGYLVATINLNDSLPFGDQLPKQAGDTGYSFNMFYAAAGTQTAVPIVNDATALMHKRQQTGLLAEGERYGYQGPFPIGDAWQWSVEGEWRYSPNPSGPDWDFVLAFTRWDPTRSLTFTELIGADNCPGGAASCTWFKGELLNGSKTIRVTMPYLIKWRVAKSKGTGASVGGTTYHVHSMKIAEPGSRVWNIWAATWANATTSLPEAVCAVTQPAAGLCGIGGVISQNDQAPNNAGLLGEYGFVSYHQTERCPQYVSKPIAAGGGYQQVNPLSVNPDWKPCFGKLPLSRSFTATNLGFIA